MKNLKHYNLSRIKTICLLLIFFLFHFSSLSQYISSTVEQVSPPIVIPASVNNPVIRIKIEVGQNPITLYALFMTTNGSTNPIADIDSAKVFYTGSSAVFTTTSQYGSTASHPNTAFTMNLTFPLNTGTNYFWVVYDINDSAIVCDSIDATCYTVYVSSGTQTPAVTDPSGNAVIGSCPTGMNDESILNDHSWLVYPNPCSDFISIQNKSLAKNLLVKLADITGKSVRLWQITSAENIFQIPVKNISEGMYLITVYDGEKIFRKKIIIQH